MTDVQTEYELTAWLTFVDGYGDYSLVILADECDEYVEGVTEFSIATFETDMRDLDVADNMLYQAGWVRCEEWDSVASGEVARVMRIPE